MSVFVLYYTYDQLGTSGESLPRVVRMYGAYEDERLAKEARVRLMEGKPYARAYIEELEVVRE